MNKLGKKNKYIHSDLKNFSADKIRQIISDQDEDLNISLKPTIGIIQNSESYDSNYRGYVGTITLSLDQNTAAVLNRELINSRPQEIINNPIIPDPTRDRTNIVRDFLRGERLVSQNILNDLSSLYLERQKLERVRQLSTSIREARNARVIPRNITDLLSSQTIANNQVDMRLAGALESDKVNTLEEKINFRYRFNTGGSTTEQTDNQSTQQNLTIKIGKSSLFFNNQNQPNIYNDFNFSVYKHYEEIKDILNYQPPTIESGNPQLDLRAVENILKFKASLEYNFLIKNYEEFLERNPSLSILNLPYFYELLEFKLAGNIPELSNYDGVPGTFSDTKAIENTSFLNYPENIISLDGVRNVVKSLVINSNLGINKSEIVSLDKYLSKFNSFKEQFPFYAEIRFSTHIKPQNNLSNLFHEYNLYSKFLTDIKINNNLSSFYNKEESNSARFLNLEGYSLNQDFIEALFNSNIVSDPALFFKLNSKLDDVKRTFVDVINGVSSHTEVVGYILQKYEKQSSTLLQEWYFPNVGNDYIEWIDTQIKLYDLNNKPQQYTYKLHLLVLSIGTVYEYYNPQKPDQEPIEINGDNVKLHYRYRPQFTVFRVDDSAQYTNYISDKPPVPPDVSIIPFVGLDNKVKFNLNTGIGKFDSIPITKNISEEELVKFISSAQNRIDNKITFESDEPSELFEIYRTDFRPKSHFDIFNGSLITINTNGNMAASYDDSVLPNKKYYYAVRSQDYHKNYSNLSNIFEVELVNDNGTIYPSIQIVDFDKDEDLKQDSKTFRRYLKISPALIQRTVVPNSATNSNIELGISTEKVWNKNMKIRLVSKQTGRKIDLKFKFKYNKIIK